jgi:hypothetical protein
MSDHRPAAHALVICGRRATHRPPNNAARHPTWLVKDYVTHTLDTFSSWSEWSLKKSIIDFVETVTGRAPALSS